MLFVRCPACRKLMRACRISCPSCRYVITKEDRVDLGIVKGKKGPLYCSLAETNERLSTRESYADAEKLYKKALAAKYTQAADMLREMYIRAACACRDGKGLPVDYQAAEEFFKKAIDVGSTKARLLLGAFYAEQIGDFASAVKLYERCCDEVALLDKEDARLLFRNYGLLLHEGRGTPVNYDLAASMLSAAGRMGDKYAEQLYAKTLMIHGVCLANGDGFEKDNDEAARLLRQACQLGAPGAEMNLAILYANMANACLDADDRNGAVSYYRQSAELGRTRSLLSLAKVYDSLLHDYPNARLVYAQCLTFADSLDADSRLELYSRLTEIYEQGLFGTVDERLCARYRRLANENAPQKPAAAPACAPPPAPSPAADADGDERELFRQLNALVGLEAVKNDVTSLVNLLKIRRIKAARGIPQPDVSLHMVFTGNPGTGKTTVARIIGRIYKHIGLLSKGHLVEVDRSGLVVGYVGQTATRVTEVVGSAMGGVLFIDEAYALTGEGNDFGSEAVNTLMKAMEDNRDDLVVIVAGYPALMEEFLNANPGLRSRFNNYFYFEDYTAPQLLEILERMCAKNSLVLTDGARAYAEDKFTALCADKPENFANARLVRNFFESAARNQADRLAGLSAITDSQLTELTEDDLNRIRRPSRTGDDV